MGNRTLNILGRVLRNLRRHNVTTSELTDEDVFDQIEQGIDLIISEINTSTSIKIVFKEGESEYSLSTDSESVLNKRNNIASIKVVKAPKKFIGFNVISNKEFFDIISNNQDYQMFPIIGTVIDNKLRIFPTPTIEDEGKEIEIIVYLSFSRNTINKETEPELPQYYDKSLELFCTSQFLSGQERLQYLSEYKSEVQRLRPLEQRKHFNLQRPSVF